MSQNKMLIDASHAEETRVVVIRDGEIDEFDFEAAARKLLKGSIFLAKVTRVEPSLQAAFVDYGGNRHGFLAFNEIHPDYYQIPHADRLALLEEEAAQQADAADDEDDDDDENGGRRSRSRGRRNGRNDRGRRDRSARAAEIDANASDAEIVTESDDDRDDDVVIVFDGADDATHDDAATDAAATFDHGDADPSEDTDAIEAAALDVTHLLPPEADDADNAFDAAAADADEAPSDIASDDADADNGGTDDAAIDGDETAEHVEAAGEGATAEGDTAEPSDATRGDRPARTRARRKPRTQAVALPRDDTVTSDVVTSSDEGVDDARSGEQATDLTDGSHASDDGSVEAEAPDDGGVRAAADSAISDRADGDHTFAPSNDLPPPVGTGPQPDVFGDRSSTVGARDQDDRGDGCADDTDDEPVAEDIGNDHADDPLEEMRPRRRRMRSYKIQEVIRRRQIVLVQVVKEERGTKGAALTTYLSLAGRYTVLMPNTARGGGISRKITNAADRKRLKAIAQELEVPEGMGLIIRTAGAARTKQEIKRDFEYLLRLWESVRDLTLRSTAPALVYEEGDLIKRSIRDLYTKDIDEICVAGEDAYREAKDFMRMLMPSHAKNVVKYDAAGSLFADYRVEQKLADMFSPIVPLRSGGYLVINQTEALVAIDINSGKATREFSIEDTALKTNLEAAEEIARQLKLRDLAGLVVVDFIDMDEKRNNRAVERRMKECLKRDRARIQVGRISHFGLLEMSRQRLRTGVLEGSTTQCPHCQGSGTIRSVQSVALAVLRGVEDALMRAPGPLIVRAAPDVAFYLLNHKRRFIAELEDRFDVTIEIVGSADTHGANFEVDRLAPARVTGRRAERAERADRRAVRIDAGFESDEEAAFDDEPEFVASEDRDPERDSDDGDRGGRKRRRRRSSRRGDRDGDLQSARDEDDVDAAETDGSEDRVNGRDANGDDASGRGRRSRRRGRRGGRRGRDRGYDVSMPGAVQPDLLGGIVSQHASASVAVATAALRIKTGDAVVVEDLAETRLQAVMVSAEQTEDDLVDGADEETSAGNGESGAGTRGANRTRGGRRGGRGRRGERSASSNGSADAENTDRDERAQAPDGAQHLEASDEGQFAPASDGEDGGRPEHAAQSAQVNGDHEPQSDAQQSPAVETPDASGLTTGSEPSDGGDPMDALAASDTTEPDRAEAPETAGAAAEVASEADPAPESRRNRSLRSTAPVVQRVVVGTGGETSTEANDADESDAEPKAPQRRGWWQRAFGN